MSKITTLMAASCLAFAGSTANAATVQNGSFEEFDGDLNSSGWNFFTKDQVPGWDSNTDQVTNDIEIQSYASEGSNGTLGLIPANDDLGNHYIELDTNQNSRISQVITFADVGNYVLSFFYSPRVNDNSQNTNGLGFTIRNGSNTLVDSSIDGAPNATYPVGTFTQVSADFTVAIGQTGSYILEFFGTGADNEENKCGDCGALIDGVEISPVPLPASSLLLLAGLGGLGAMRRMKRS